MRWGRDHHHEATLRELFERLGFPEETRRSMTAHAADTGHRAIVAREHAGGLPTDPLRWHVSVSGPGRTPTWEELVEAVHALRPGVVFTVGIPPRTWWLNVHPDVLHAWETSDEHLVAEYRANATGQAPT